MGVRGCSLDDPLLGVEGGQGVQAQPVHHLEEGPVTGVPSSLGPTPATCGGAPRPGVELAGTQLPHTHHPSHPPASLQTEAFQGRRPTGPQLHPLCCPGETQAQCDPSSPHASLCWKGAETTASWSGFQLLGVSGSGSQRPRAA